MMAGLLTKMIPIKYITEESKDCEVNEFMCGLCGAGVDYMSDDALPILRTIISEIGDNQKLVIGENILNMVNRDKDKLRNCGARERSRAIAMLLADKGWSDEQVARFRDRFVKPALNGLGADHDTFICFGL